MSSLRERLTGGTDGPPPPNAWTGLFIGFAFVLSTAVATVLLFTLWAAARPVNLVPVTDAFVRMTQETLRAHETPSSAIIISGPMLYENPAAVWHHYDIRVDLPPMQHPDAIVRDLREVLEPRHVVIDQTLGTDGGHDLRMTHAGIEFAVVSLRGGRIGPERKRDYRAAAERVARQVERIVHERLPEEGQLAIMPAEDREDANTLWKFVRFEAFVPDDLIMRDMQRAIEVAMAGREVSVESEERAGGAERVVRISYQRYPVVNLYLSPRPPRILPEIQAPVMEAPGGVSIFDPGAIMEPDAPAQSSSTPLPGIEWTGPPRIALIIDDGGEEPEATETILGLDRALTLAILPDTTSGTALAQRAAAMGFEVMLHMPMETENAGQNYPNSLMTNMDADEMAQLLDRAREQVPGAVGINNHTGGTFTADPASVERLMAYLSATPLYFVDSRTSPRTVAFESARAFGIPAAQRDVFLDNEPNFDYIEGRFNELVALARARGSAIGIAHFRPRTAEALATLLPRLEEEGVRLTPVSELLQ